VADWVTISALATAGGTLVLAGTTYASVRSANRAARVAEMSLLAGLRPLLIQSSDADPPQLYELTTETSMPHLEENLRYANTTRRQCLAQSQLTTAFPILGHPALQGCKLENERRQPQSLSYQLVCTGGHGTTGAAVWHLDEHRLRGTLDIKLGGQRTFLVADALTACRCYDR